LIFTTLGQVQHVQPGSNNHNNCCAQLNGSVNAMITTDVTFEYGTTISYGSTITATQSPFTGNTIINVNATLTGLTQTTYHYRIKAVNSLGTTYGSDLTFTTLGQVPTCTTLAASNITTLQHN